MKYDMRTERFHALRFLRFVAITGVMLTVAAVSASASDTFVGSGDATGVDETTVYVNNLEDHTWSYYQENGGIDASYGYPSQLCSPDPRNVKITYIGLGIFADDESIVTNGVAVSNKDGEGQNKFVYYETLEKGDDGRYSYSVIPNPFTKRPSRIVSGDAKTYYGCRKWKVTALSGGTITDADGNEITVDGPNCFINADTDVKFAPSSDYTPNCISMEVVLTSYWEVADRALIEGTNAIDYSSLTKDSRDLNFLVLNRTAASTITNPIPVTVMMMEPDGSADYTTATANNISGITTSTVALRVENARVGISGDFYISSRDLFFGRGLIGGVSKTNSGTAYNCIIGGVMYGTSTMSSGLRYRLRVESGRIYKAYWIGNGASITGSTIDCIAIHGCDYDRAKYERNHETMQSVDYRTAVLSHSYIGQSCRYSGVVQSGQTFIRMLFKSGRYQTGPVGDAGGSGAEYIYCSNNSVSQNGHRYIELRGGHFNSLGSGYSTNDKKEGNEYVSPQITFRIRGGMLEGSIYGAAAQSTTYGVTKIIITGGRIKGWIAGGCNGWADSGDGILYGSTYVYIGGKAAVSSDGSGTMINTSVGGNVYGAGCGRPSRETSGQVTQGTNVVIADDSFVERNVYGGGNYGFSGGDSNFPNSTHVFLLGGTVNGSVFGGANQKKAYFSDIVMLGKCKVLGGIYGGSNITGVQYNDVTVLLISGQVGHDASLPANVHGGGYGASTEVQGNISVSIGRSSGDAVSADKENVTDLTIYGDVYGGSALGKTNTTASKTTSVKMYSGTVTGNVFGGGNQGDVTGSPVVTIGSPVVSIGE